jgi:hypothetical protein
VHEPLEILALRLRKEQRVQDEALVLLSDVVHTSSRPGHVQRELNCARSRPLQMLSSEDGKRRA